jgi:hypothetical protein
VALDYNAGLVATLAALVMGADDTQLTLTLALTLTLTLTLALALALALALTLALAPTRC